VLPVVTPVRVTVKVNGVVPLFPSSFTASVAAIDKAVLLLTMVPVAEPPVMMRDACTGETGVTVPRWIEKVSFGSTFVSPLMVTVIFLVSPALPAKLSGLAVVTT